MKARLWNEWFCVAATAPYFLAKSNIYFIQNWKQKNSVVNFLIRKWIFKMQTFCEGGSYALCAKSLGTSVNNECGGVSFLRANELFTFGFSEIICFFATTDQGGSKLAQMMDPSREYTAVSINRVTSDDARTPSFVINLLEGNKLSKQYWLELG